jgi:hypothetical protein
MTYLNTILFQMYSVIIGISTMFENDAYKDEKEYRLLHIIVGFPNPKPEVQYKMRLYELVRYRSFRWRAGDTPVLKCIVMGPAADKRKSATFAKSCLREFHNDISPKVVLEYSRVPYRG